MRKFVMFLLIVAVAIVVGAIYGVIHDQVTYSISPEYYTKFKFIQFDLADSVAAQHMTQPRSAVVMVGVKATWWMGLYIGVIIGLIAFIGKDPETMFQLAIQAVGWVIVVAVLTGIIGGVYGHYVLVKSGVNWWLPEHLVDKPAFITVGSIHNFSYLGGGLGLLAGIIFMILKNRAIRRRSQSI
ncbi:hypothetical protein ACX0G9_12685 [Flavitalea flava]